MYGHSTAEEPCSFSGIFSHTPQFTWPPSTHKLTSRISINKFNHHDLVSAAVPLPQTQKCVKFHKTWTQDRPNLFIRCSLLQTRKLSLNILLISSHCCERLWNGDCKTKRQSKTRNRRLILSFYDTFLGRSGKGSF